MKRILSTACAVVLLLAVMAPLAPGAYALSDDVKGESAADVEWVLRYFGVMQGYPDGSFGSADPLTRAQFCKLMISLSSYRGSVSGASAVSPFPDVKHTHWAAGYVAAASKAGFMKGYSDGSFKPERGVLYEEALKVALLVMGYTESDITGGYPHGYIAKAQSLELTSGISVAQGQGMTRRDVAYLVFNMLNSTSKDGKDLFYVSLGLDHTGELTRAAVADTKTEGPFTYIKELPGEVTGITGLSVFRDDKTSTLKELRSYDVYYYNTHTKTLWIYSDKVTGTLDSVASRHDPASVTVGGKSYSITEDAAKSALGEDGLALGIYVTLLLDRTGGVCDAYSAADVNGGGLAGVVISGGAKSFAGGPLTSYVTVRLTDGTQTDVPVGFDDGILVGDIVNLDYTGGQFTAKKSIKFSGVGGTVSASARTIGSTKLADDVTIMELDSYGAWALVSLARLDGMYMNADYVRAATVNELGQATCIVLKNATGDLYKYGLVTAINEDTTAGAEKGTYGYTVGGKSGSFTVSGKVLGLTVGPHGFDMNGEKAENAFKLESFTADGIDRDGRYVDDSSGGRFLVADGVEVYMMRDGKYVYSSLEALLGSKPRVINAYYDKVAAGGGRIRVIVYW